MGKLFVIIYHQNFYHYKEKPEYGSYNGDNNGYNGNDSEYVRIC